MGGGDVEEAEFVGARLVVNDRLLHRIAGIAQAFEIHALDDAAILHVQAGDDTNLEHYMRPLAMAAMFIRVRPVTASAGTPVVRVISFGFQQHVQRLAQLVGVPALRLRLEGGGAGEMHRRTQPLHHRIDAFAARRTFARLHQLLEMAHGAADHLGRLGVRRPQPFQLAVQLDQIAAARRIAGAFAAGLGLVAHHGAHILDGDLLLAVHIQDKLFQLAPGHAAVRAQPRHRIFQRVGRDGRPSARKPSRTTSPRSRTGSG